MGEIDLDKIFLFGRSLGGAVAIYTASEVQKRCKNVKIAGLIIENTFSSISDMVGKEFMLKIHWRSIDLIPSIETKMLFLACSNDEIVPHEQMLKLYASAHSAQSKDMYVIQGGTHNDGWMRGGDTYWTKMRDFIHSPSKL